MESVINDLQNKAGIYCSSLYMAWDFTVASQESVTGRALTIRDDAFERLGDSNLADRKIQGDSPDFDILAYCDSSDPGAASAGTTTRAVVRPTSIRPTRSPHRYRAAMSSGPSRDTFAMSPAT